LFESVGTKSAVTAYVAALVGAVDEPLYFTFATVPGTELVEIPTVADCGEPLYVCGELLTAIVAVGVALLIVSVIVVDGPAGMLL
jgi:hypothetical protein